jgi:hypothetical protein
LALRVLRAEFISQFGVDLGPGWIILGVRGGRGRVNAGRPQTVLKARYRVCGP